MIGRAAAVVFQLRVATGVRGIPATDFIAGDIVVRVRVSAAEGDTFVAKARETGQVFRLPSAGEPAQLLLLIRGEDDDIAPHRKSTPRLSPDKKTLALNACMFI